MARPVLSKVASNMKKCDTNNAGAALVPEFKSVQASTGDSALNSILRLAYRRHSRGRVAREAVAACLGR